MRFIGDVHGKYDPYRELIRKVPRSVQVGDMGVGFRRMQGPLVGEEFGNPPHYAMVQGDHRFIRGNHDNPGACLSHSQWIPDGTVQGEVMFVGGAVSIDRVYRQEGYSWWPDEELTIEQLNGIVDNYLRVRPGVMVTHECPEDVAVEIARSIGSPKLDPRFASRTRQAFQSMWTMHGPRLWIFGHWHVPFDHVLNGTRFICLPELAHVDLEVDC